MGEEQPYQFELNFVCPGGNKCGTTWLSEMLRQHPELNVALNKEPHFFSSNYDKGYDWYLKNWADKPGLKGEFSTSYLYSDKAIERLSNDYPNVKVIINLRDPYDRAVSHFRHLLRDQGKINTEAFLESHFEIIGNSLYYEKVRQLLDKFSREQLFFVVFDRIKENPQELLDEVCGFLGVSHFKPSDAEKKIGEGYEVKSKTLEKIRIKTYYLFKRAGLYKAIRLTKKSGLPDLVKKKNARKETHSYDIEMRKEITKYVAELHDDLEKLMALGVVHNEAYLNNWLNQLQAIQKEA